MRSILRSAFTPAVRRLLEAIDERNNSNTLWLAVVPGLPVYGAASLRLALEAWISDPVFGDLLAEAAEAAGWGCNQYGRGFAPTPAPPHLSYPMSPDEFVRRLWWLLQDAPSPYLRSVTGDDAEALIRGFLGELWGAGSVSSASADGLLASTPRVAAQWWLADADVKLLGPRLGKRYFDNLGADTATFLGSGERSYLLLTNGSD